MGDGGASKTDLVLLHAPSVYDFRERSIMYGPVSDMVPSTPVFEMYPLGFTSLAEYLERHGFSVRIVNLAVLMLERRNFDVETAIALMDPVAFGIDLHWLPHAHGAIEIARIVKEFHPDTPVIFGGLSATYFHEELAAYDCVDYVVRGDCAEEPTRRLLTALKRGGSLADVPNLTWKDKTGAIESTPLAWIPWNLDDISLDYSYNMRAVIRYRDVLGSVPFKDWLDYPVCAALTSHGCTHDCATCGGSAHAFRTHFGRDRIAFRDPERVVADIANIQRYIPGPIFVLNDFLQAGPDYVQALIRGLGRIHLRNPIGFEFFLPPQEDLYELMDANLKDYSVEISLESHDEAVRKSFGKSFYSLKQVEDSICAALRNRCKRFDVYFMSGLPGQTGRSVLDTVEYVRGLYERTGNDPRLMPFLSPMAPFLDPGSKAFDDPERYGYRLLARSLEEHRQLLLQPSWRYTMNYESASLPRKELAEVTYAAAIGLNRLKASVGATSPEAASLTESRIIGAATLMSRIDGIVDGDAARRPEALAGLRQEVRRMSESTVCGKSELEWKAHADPRMVMNVLGLWFRENLALVARHHTAPEITPPVSPLAEEEEPPG